jgi:hypothetical protein
MFWKLDLSPSSGEWETPAQLGCEMLCSLVVRILDDGHCPKTQSVRSYNQPHLNIILRVGHSGRTSECMSAYISDLSNNL